jgi:ELP3 family radical SAM enzyme/protein acetyltransferase
MNYIDIENIVENKINKHSNDYKNTTYTDEEYNIVSKELIDNIDNIRSNNDVIKFQKDMQKKYKISLSKSNLIYFYKSLNLDNNNLKKLITKKKSKSNSGVVVITILTSGSPEYIDDEGNRVVGKFSCKHNCAYCPNEKGHEGNNWIDQPRSYLYSEPAVLRANENKFDPILQFNSRVDTLIKMGHVVDKLELIVLGGTWSNYHKNYKDQFIREVYYAANTYYDKRDMLSLEEELTMNESAKIHIIGLTLETRPDTITLNEIREFRRYNCTRVQLGVQHTDNEVLKKIKRGHSIEKVYYAIKLLKDNGYKVDIHLMPNLPGSSYELDKKMLENSLYDERLQVDQYKIYPTAIVPWTQIKTWYEEGSYVPYDDYLLFELIKEFKKKIQKWKRLNRIIRDIPSTYISGGYKDKYVNMRQLLQDDMKKNNWCCNCIRCREVKDNSININDIRIDIEKYKSSSGDEYFISLVTDKYLIGFIRLRLIKFVNNDNDNIENVQLSVLNGTALIRELHVYSNMSDVGNNVENSYQHKGYGKKLLETAEEISKTEGFNKIAIISGTGVRNYYRKNGYELIDTYMIKVF